MNRKLIKYFKMLVILVIICISIPKVIEFSIKSKYPVGVFKVYTEDTLVFSRGSKFEYARVESMSLCLSIVQAYNFARLDDLQRGGDFGAARHSYQFQCEE